MNKAKILILLIVCLSLQSMAQRRSYVGEIKVTPAQIEQIGDSLYIDLTIDVKNVRVRTNRAVTLLPILISSGNQTPLPKVQIQGRDNMLVARRKVALMNKAQREAYYRQAPYALVKGFPSKGEKQIHYSQVVPFRAWMGGSMLYIRKTITGCGKGTTLSSTDVGKVTIEPVIPPYIIKPHLAYVQPPIEAVKVREMTGEAFLDFIVSKFDIRPDYMNNPRELKKITDMITELKNDGNIMVKGIKVIGYASPEGGYKFNRQLSENRAMALVNYLKPRFDYPGKMYSISFGGENWAGLRAVISASDLSFKDDVMQILDNSSITDEERKTKLKRLSNGEVYRYLLKNIYPSLRKAICKINFEVRGFDADQAAEVFKTRPGNLSLNELYMVANKYPVGSDKFIEVFNAAVVLYPTDVVANLNAASVALEKRDVVLAEKYLDKVTVKSAQYYNSMAVLMILKDEYQQAREYLDKAIAADGLPQAEENLEELNLKMDNIEKIKIRNQRHGLPNN